MHCFQTQFSFHYTSIHSNDAHNEQKKKKKFLKEKKHHHPGTELSKAAVYMAGPFSRCRARLWLWGRASAALDKSLRSAIVTLKSNQSLLFAFQAAPGCHSLKITILPPLSCLINKSDVQFRNFAINLLKYCWRMLIVMPVAIKAHLHNLCVKNNYEPRSQTRSTNCS